MFIPFYRAIQWLTIAKIVASWVISPLLSGVMAITLYKVVTILILKADSPVSRAFVFLPIFYSLVVAFNTFSILHTMNKSKLATDFGVLTSFSPSLSDFFQSMSGVAGVSTPRSDVRSETSQISKVWLIKKTMACALGIGTLGWLGSPSESSSTFWFTSSCYHDSRQNWRKSRIQKLTCAIPISAGSQWWKRN